MERPEPPGTDSLWALIESAHRLGVDRALASSGDFAPFGIAAADASGGKVLEAPPAVAGRPFDEQVQAFRELLGTVARNPEGALFSVAIVYDSFVTPEGSARLDAIAVEAYERGLPSGLLIAQPYTRKKSLRKGKAEGKAIILRTDLETIF